MTHKKCTKHATARLQSILKEYDDLKKTYNDLLVKYNHNIEIISKQDELIQAQTEYIKSHEKLQEKEVLYKKSDKPKRDDLHASLLKQIKAFTHKNKVASDMKCLNKEKMTLILKELKERHSKREQEDPIIIDEMYIKSEPNVTVNTVPYTHRRACIVM